MFAKGVVVKTEYFRKLLLPVGFLMLVLAIWQLADTVLEIKRIILPSPLEITKESFGRAGELLWATGVTAMAACIGFAISMILGTVLALVFSASRLARQCGPLSSGRSSCCGWSDNRGCDRGRIHGRT